MEIPIGLARESGWEWSQKIRNKNTTEIPRDKELKIAGRQKERKVPDWWTRRTFVGPIFSIYHPWISSWIHRSSTSPLSTSCRLLVTRSTRSDKRHTFLTSLSVCLPLSFPHARPMRRAGVFLPLNLSLGTERRLATGGRCLSQERSRIS